MNAPAPLELSLGAPQADPPQAARIATLYGAARSVYVASPLAAMYRAKQAGRNHYRFCSR